MTQDHVKQLEELARIHGTDLQKGLTNERAEDLRRVQGKNDASVVKPKYSNMGSAVGSVMGSFCFQLLNVTMLICFVNYFLDFDLLYNLIAGCSCLFIMLISILVSIRSYKLDREKTDICKLVRVYRSGSLQEVPLSDLVCGDVIQISAGDMLPADVRIIEDDHFAVDSSSSFLQSTPSRSSTPSNETNPFLAHNVALFGSMCTMGTAKAIVVATGHSAMIVLLERERAFATAALKTRKNKGCSAVMVWDRVVGEWFLIGMAAAIGLAAAIPQLGVGSAPLVTTVKYGLVPFVFFLSGISLSSSALKQALFFCKLNILIQVFNLVFIPAVVYAAAKGLDAVGFDESMIKGLIIMSAVPTTVGMCSILTSAAGANVSISVINATIGNFLGIFLTPALLLLLLGSKSSIEIWPVVQQLLLLLLAPLMFGQVIQCCIGASRFNNIYFKKAVGAMNKLILIVILFQSFCKTFSSKITVATSDLVATIGICLGMYLVFLGLARLVFSLPCLKVSRADQVPSWFCGTHKTVAMGVPLITIVFAGTPDVGVVSLPLLMYHPIQMIVGTLLVPVIEKWVNSSGTNEEGKQQENEIKVEEVGLVEAQGLVEVRINLTIEQILAEARIKVSAK